VIDNSVAQPTILERARHPISRRDIEPNVLKILYRLINAGHLAYLVGGSVRDLMLKRRPKDFDIATSAHPHEIRALFRNSRLIGRRFRLVHVFFGPRNIEVATFRRRGEELTASDDLMIRHDNTFGTPEEDAFRRDFTVNALFYDPRTFHVIDYVGGVADLEHRLIRTVGDPEIRMREDPVRMLRAVRFAGKLDFTIEPATDAAIRRYRNDIAKASTARLAEEIYRTIGCAGGAASLALMEELGLLEVLLPMLSFHLRHSLGSTASAPTLRNLTALMSEAGGTELSHAFILAALFADLHLTNLRRCEKIELPLVNALRQRGFSRADTEHMRLLLDAIPHFLAPSRMARRLARRPYFAEAMRLYRIIAPTYGGDVEGLERFLSEPALRQGNRAVRHSPRNGQIPEGARPSRRRRRGGRRRRRSRQPALTSLNSDAAPEATAMESAAPILPPSMGDEAATEDRGD
jgi:poly(A) polymerase